MGRVDAVRGFQAVAWAELRPKQWVRPLLGVWLSQCLIKHLLISGLRSPFIIEAGILFSFQQLPVFLSPEPGGWAGGETWPGGRVGVTAA